MTFTRTDAGLSNQHLFHKVDYVVFVEGSEKELSFQEVCQGYSGIASFDILYWQAIFNKFVSKKKVKFKPVGSKSILRVIAKKVELGEINHVWVAMDQNTDRFRNEYIQSNGVFYTWGYSWENDVLQLQVLIDLFFVLCPIERAENEKDVSDVISQLYYDFIHKIRHFVHVDMLLLTKGKSLFPRRNYKRLIKCNPAHTIPPELKISELKRLLSECNKQFSNLKPFFFNDKYKPNTIRYCFGHLLCIYCYRALMYALKKFAQMPYIALDYMTSMATRLFGDSLDSTLSEEIFEHHTKQFEFINS